jgi:hypothetical protein
MPRRKITEEEWPKLYRAYQEWEPSKTDGQSIAEVLEPFGVAKQTFYNEMHRRGLPLKGVKVPTVDSPAFNAVLETLVECRLRCRLLEQYIADHGLQMPVS